MRPLCQEESVVQNPFAEVAHGAVLHRAAPLEQHIERHDDPPHAVTGNGLELLAQRGGLGRGLGVGVAFLGDALTGEEELQVDGQCAEDGDGQHGEEPQVLVLLQREGNEHREYHRAAAHNAQTRHVGEGSQRTALLAVTGWKRGSWWSWRCCRWGKRPRSTGCTRWRSRPSWPCPQTAR